VVIETNFFFFQKAILLEWDYLMEECRASQTLDNLMRVREFADAKLKPAFGEFFSAIALALSLPLSLYRLSVLSI
jgi:hypothetical protein